MTRRPSSEPTDRHELVRRANVELVFRAIGDHGPISKPDLVRLTGLSKPTVLGLVAALEDEGLIRPRPIRRTGAVGRAPMVYEHDPGAAHVIGIDVGGTKISAGIADLAGNLMEEVETGTTTAGGQAVIDQLVEVARGLARRTGVPWSKVDAVSIGTPGVLAADGTLGLAQNVTGLGAVPVLVELRRALRTTVVLENDVNMAVIGELEAGVAASCRTFALLAIGTGVGAGLVIDGRLVRGANGAAGEVAYLPIGGDPTTADARVRGTLEVAIAGSGVQALIASELGRRRANHSALDITSTARDAYELAAAGDAVARRVVARHAELVARAVLSLVSVIDPELVVVGGGIGSNPLLLPPLRAELARLASWPVRVETSALGARAGLIGAIHHARRSIPQIESDRVSVRLQTGAGS
ncbi:MAG: ROK family transcriptional regulator [Ilumatobacteraceae bacterium]